MDFNTLLLRLGIDPSNFSNRLNEPIRTENGFIYEVNQEVKERICPHCRSKNVIINDYDVVEINCSETDQIKDILRVKKVRFKCKDCNKTYTPNIKGIPRYSKTSSQTLHMILNDFTKLMTFKDIAQRYGLTTARVLQIFDDNIKFVPRKTMPITLCIDEIHFKEDIDQNYCCVLYDYDNSEIVDIIKNRKSAYLEEYFNNIPEKERNHVRIFISDMYDGYASVRKKYFKKAIHVVDLFHVINQLTVALNKLRVKVMNAQPHDSLYYRFMKDKWRLFICKRNKIPNKFYISRKTGEIYHYDDLLFKCLLLDNRLLETYNALQDLYHYKEDFYSFNEAYDFINHLSNRLSLIDDDGIKAVSNTYRKWSGEIASALSKSQTGRRYTNGIAEAINNQLKTIIKSAYGYHNFERFRKRAMMIITYKRDLR